MPSFVSLPFHFGDSHLQDLLTFGQGKARRSITWNGIFKHWTQAEIFL